jgi:hypothetical protein
MAIAFDASSKKFVNNAASLTQAHTCSGVDRVLVVVVNGPESADKMAAGTVTYGGVSMGAPVASSLNSVNYSRMYVLVNPPAGTANIVVTPSASAYLNMIAASFTGVDQTTPVSASNALYQQYSVNPTSLAITTLAGGVAVSSLTQYQLTGALSCDATQTLVDISTDALGRIGLSYKSDATAMAWAPTPINKNATNLIVALAPVGGGSTDATAPGATLTGTSSISAGSASGGSGGTDATAPGATLTGTSSISAGSASGNGGAGTFTSDAMENNTGAGLLASTPVTWTWWQGAIGATPTSLTHGSGTTSAGGILSLTGLPTGAGFLLVRTADSAGVYYQPGTVT